MPNKSEIEISGFDELAKRLGALSDQGKRAESSALLRAGDIIKEAVAEETPVRSGELKKSLRRSGVRQGKGGKYVLVWPTKFYAHMVEFGTVKMRANPFMARGYEKSKSAAIAAMEAEIRKALGL